MRDIFPAPLTKSRFVKGWQCHKLLWWTVREPQAPELTPTKVLKDRFDQGRHVTELARERFPGAMLIPYGADESRVEATRFAIDFGTPAILEGVFSADGVLVAVDILLKERDAYTLIEVKSSSHLKDDHIPDAAIQTHVLRRCKVDVRKVEILHLNREFRYPDRGDLFVREDVTAPVEAFLPQVPGLIAGQLAAFPSVARRVAGAQLTGSLYGVGPLAFRRERGLRPLQAWPALPTLAVAGALVATGATTREAVVAACAVLLGLGLLRLARLSDRQ